MRRFSQEGSAAVTAKVSPSGDADAAAPATRASAALAASAGCLFVAWSARANAALLGLGAAIFDSDYPSSLAGSSE